MPYKIDLKFYQPDSFGSVILLREFKRKKKLIQSEKTRI